MIQFDSVQTFNVGKFDEIELFDLVVAEVQLLQIDEVGEEEVVDEVDEAVAKVEIL